MIDYFFQMGLSNACLSLALGIVAMIVGAKARRPQLAHLLWLLVFIKLLTPPIVTVPIVTIPAQGETALAINGISQPGPMLSNNPQLNIEVSQWSKLGSAAWNHARIWLSPIWLLGSVVVFAFSTVRICRFSRLLAAKSEVARQELQTTAVEIARRLGLNKIPTILTTAANLSPMVWWTGGKVRIVIPTTLLDQMDAQQWQWILAHELAHVRRRDYLVRWLEWLACVVFWWNPVVWWAQRNLRATEEICCDDLVISCLSPKPKFYANSLLSAVEFLAGPVLRPPAMASEINSGGFLERRFKMIVSDNTKKSNTRWLKVCVLLFAVVVLPLGIASAQDYEAVGRRLRAAVEAGELTGEQARAMLGALRQAAQPDEPRSQRGDRRIGREDYTGFERRFKAAVEAGKMSREEAGEKLGAYRRRMAMADRGSDKRADYEGFERRIKAGVREGKMTREEAGEQLKGFRRRLGMAEQGERRITREDCERAEAELDKAVAEGKISKEAAKARLNGMRKMMAGQGERRRTARGDMRTEYEGFERRIKAAVREGKMTREEAGEKLAGLRRRMEMTEQGERGERRITVEEYKRAEAKMRRMIEEGKAKPEDVERRLIEMRKMINDQSKRGSERGDRERPGWEGIKRRIEGAVKSGKMTREEADAKYKEIRERMAGRSER